MKIVLYMDSFAGMDPKHAYASANPGPKVGENTIRYAVVFEIPDPAQPDKVVEATAVATKE